MNYFIIFCIFISATASQAKSWEVLQKSAEEQFLNKTTIETKQGPHPAKIVEIELNEPVTRVVLNRIDNPLFKATKAYTEYAFSLTKDVDFVEIFLYAGDETLNCYAAFEEGKFRDLTKCNRD